MYDDSSDRGGSRSSGNNSGIKSDLRKKFWISEGQQQACSLRVEGLVGDGLRDVVC